MWDAFGIIGKIVTAIIGFYVTGTKTKKDLDEAFYAWAKFRGRGNESADDRESVDSQHERIADDRMRVLMADLDNEIAAQALANAKARTEKAEPIKPLYNPLISGYSGTAPTRSQRSGRSRPGRSARRRTGGGPRASSTSATNRPWSCPTP